MDTDIDDDLLADIEELEIEGRGAIQEIRDPDLEARRQTRKEIRDVSRATLIAELEHESSIESLLSRINMLSAQNSIPEIKSAIDKVLIKLQEKPNQTTRRADNLARLAKQCHRYDDTSKALNLSYQAEAIYSKSETQQDLRSETLTIIADIHLKAKEYAKVDETIKLYDSITSPRPRARTGNIDLLNKVYFEITGSIRPPQQAPLSMTTIKMAFYENQERFVNLLSTIRSCKIVALPGQKLLSLDEIDKNIDTMLSEADVLYKLGSIFEGYHVLCEISKFFQRYEGAFNIHIPRLTSLYLRYCEVFVDPSKFKLAQGLLTLTCYCSGQTFEIANLEVCRKCNTAQYCSARCRDYYTETHYLECIRLSAFREQHGVDQFCANLGSIFNIILGDTLTDFQTDKAKFKESVSASDRMLRELPFFDDKLRAFLYYRQASALHLIGNDEDALWYAEAADEIYKSDLFFESVRRWNLLMLANIYVSLGRYEDAESIWPLIKPISRESYNGCLDDLEFLVASVEGAFYIKMERYQDAINTLRAVTTQEATPVIPCKMIEIDLLYGMKYFVRADMICDVLISYGKKNPHVDVLLRPMIDQLKSKTSRALQNPRDYEYHIADMPVVCAGCWIVSTAESRNSYVCCTDCHGVYYCGSQCQTAEWARHKKSGCHRYRINN
jgi:tetratricopeptide (TPR) repeat protein